MGCEPRPQPGTPVVLVETDKSSNTLSEDGDQELDSEDSEDSQNKKSDDDFFSDNTFELSSDQMNEPAGPLTEGDTDKAQPISTSSNELPTDEVSVDVAGRASQDDGSADEAEGSETQMNLPIVLVDLLDTVPPRAVLMLPSGEES